MARVRTTSGEMEGLRKEGVLRFAGIPFAAAPTGDRRFKRPAPADSWDGLRQVHDFGATSHQADSPLTQMLGGEAEPMDEDCLFLNVFTPEADDADRPVMVWIHGGGFVMGSGSSPMYDGSSLARRGDVVVVTINYRLGALGFLSVDDLGYGDGSHNAGILDQVAALEWVRDNIGQFGGDANNVTIFGESAGGMSVGTLLGTPAAKGLFHKAILQSGAAHNISSPKDALEVRDEVVAKIPGGLERLMEATPAEILSAQGDLFLDSIGRFDDKLREGIVPSLLPYQPVQDDLDLPEAPIDAVRAGSVADVPLLIGTTRDEWKLFALMNQIPFDDEAVRMRLGAILGDADRALETYQRSFPEASPTDLFGAAVTDFVFRQPAIRLAEAQLAAGGTAYQYLFTWASPAFGGMLGSCHALDVPFVFDNLEGLGMLLGDQLPPSLVDAMQESWIAFARSGNPSNEVVGEWAEYDAEGRPVMQLDEESTLLNDPYPAERELWEGVV